MKSLMRYRGLMVIVLWQAAPVGVDQYGRTRIGFGVGGGQLEYFTGGGCGSPVEHHAYRYRQTAAEVEHYTSPKLRMSGAVGKQSSDSDLINGFFGGLQLAREGRVLGIGGGMSLIPDTAGLITVPNIHLRVGNPSRLHVRAEVYPPSVHSPAEVNRVVVGYNQRDHDRPAVYAGIANFQAYASASTYKGFVAEWFQPISSRIALGLHGFTAKGDSMDVNGLTAQVRINVQ